MFAGCFRGFFWSNHALQWCWSMCDVDAPDVPLLCAVLLPILRLHNNSHILYRYWGIGCRSYHTFNSGLGSLLIVANQFCQVVNTTNATHHTPYASHHTTPHSCDENRKSVAGQVATAAVGNLVWWPQGSVTTWSRLPEPPHLATCCCWWQGGVLCWGRGVIDLFIDLSLNAACNLVTCWLFLLLPLLVHRKEGQQDTVISLVSFFSLVCSRSSIPAHTTIPNRHNPTTHH